MPAMAGGGASVKAWAGSVFGDAAARVLALVVLAMVTLVTLLTAAIPVFPKNPAVEMGSIIVLSVSAVMILIFLVAIGFSALGLADGKEALGLPAGSVRALIALLLLLMFVFFSIYLFAQLSLPTGSQRMDGLTQQQLAELGSLVVGKITYADGLTTAFISVPISEGVERFANQVFTAALTLVTAVSSFYFATRTAEGALAAVAAPAQALGIATIDPSKGTIGTRVSVKITGTGFESSTRVKLQRGPGPEIAGFDVEYVGPTELKCTFNVVGPAGTRNVIVSNSNGKYDVKLDGFEIV